LLDPTYALVKLRTLYCWCWTSIEKWREVSLYFEWHEISIVWFHWLVKISTIFYL